MNEPLQNPFEGSDKYRVISELGRGGMGEVFLCEHTGLGAKVVVKLLHAELSERSGLVDRMRLEAQSLARLNHPNIVRVTDFDRTPSGRPFFVMEYLPGRSLGDDVNERGGVLPVAEAIDVVRQALAGLAAAHQAGMVHRDIKLDNLFVAEVVGQDGRPQRVIKILDFGVAKMLSPSDDAPAPLAVPTKTGMVVGTPRFFAPEQARGQKLDHRADIYAMGLVLYQLLAGRGPFDDCTNITEMAKAHVFRPPEPPSRLAPQPVPPELDHAVLRATMKKPEERFQSAADFSAALDQAAARLAGGGPPAGAAAHAAPATQYAAPAMAVSQHAMAAAAPNPTHAGMPPAQTHGSGAMMPTGPLPTSFQAATASGTGQHRAPTQHMAAPPVMAASPTPLPGAGSADDGVRRYPAGLAAVIVVAASLVGAAIAAVAMM